MQEEEARKRKELEEIMAENNKKIEEAQRKLVSTFINLLPKMSVSHITKELLLSSGYPEALIQK